MGPKSADNLYGLICNDSIKMNLISKGPFWISVISLILILKNFKEFEIDFTMSMTLSTSNGNQRATQGCDTFDSVERIVHFFPIFHKEILEYLFNLGVFIAKELTELRVFYRTSSFEILSLKLISQFLLEISIFWVIW